MCLLSLDSRFFWCIHRNLKTDTTRFALKTTTKLFNSPAHEEWAMQISTIYGYIWTMQKHMFFYLKLWSKSLGEIDFTNRASPTVLHFSNLPKSSKRGIQRFCIWSLQFGQLGKWGSKLGKIAKLWTTLQTRSCEQSHTRGKRVRLETFYFYPLPSPNANSLGHGLVLSFAFCFGSLQIATNVKSICQIRSTRRARRLLGLCLDASKNPKLLQDSPSHRILRHMYGTLNIDKKDN